MEKKMYLDVYDIFNGRLSDFFKTSNGRSVINTINPHSFMVARRDRDFNSALLSSDILLPDGIGIVISLLLLRGEKVVKITGPQFLEYSLGYYNKTHGRVFFLGSSHNVLKCIASKLKYSHPNIAVEFFSPPFSKTFTQEQNNEMVFRINKFIPDMLFVGMTAPKQEKWVFDNKEMIVKCNIASIGAAFDWFSGVKTPPTKIANSLNLVWLERFIRDPIRMMPRIKSMIYFIFVIFKLKIKNKK